MILSLRTKQEAAAVGHGPVWLKAFVLPLLIAFSLTAIPNIAQAVTNQQDVDALIALQLAWSGKAFSWDTSTDPCDDLWLGIVCDINKTWVVGMFLINQDLAGTLSPAVGNFKYLTFMDLSSNPKLEGPLPAEIGNLTSMQRLFLQSCNFSGPIPAEIGNMTSLQYLALSQNSLTGPLPATIGLLKNLIWLDVSSNHLNGYLPESTTSGIGSGLDNLTNALHFHLQDNAFSGSIPSSIFNTGMQLIHLLLNHNNLTGNIPPALANLLHVEILCLDFNSLNGTVPSTINTISNLTTLQLNNNNLTGQLPDLSNNTKLQMLTLGNNLFETSEIPSWITNMTNLYLLSMDSANLNGSIPADIFSHHLSNVTLGSNQLSGTLNLTTANSSSLLLVNLTNNNIINLEKGDYTQELLLDGNPYCVSNKTECATLQSTTSTPPAASSSTAMASKCTNECSTEYAINPKDSGSCQCARPVVATCSFYATKIPLLTDYNISEMEQQYTTGLSNSPFLQLTLQDTQAVVNIISNNEVKISIFPPNNTTLWSSSVAALISYVLQNQDIEFLLIGPMSCGFTGSPYVSVLVVNELSTAVKIGIGVGAAVLGIAVLLLGLYAMKLKRRAVKAEKLNKPFAAWIAAGQEETADIPQLKGARWFSLEEIRKCTNNFSHSNEIGEGGYGKVYKGFLVSGDCVAIKRASTSSLQGAAEFKNEIELLSRVHHRNLVGLIGFCFEEGEQMLVYEYMPNGTLRECLSGRIGLQMDWNRRIGLALGSARGIAYLHTQANPPVIHRDIKSTNILLDEKLVAKVADFGLSKLAPEGDAPMSTHVKGTMGYLDPNYYMTHLLTDKSDVYSFGVVLLELVTGRQPIQGGKYIVREVTTTLAKGGMDLLVQNLVDPNLTDYPFKAVERLVQVALNCVQDDPTKRLTMAEVVKELEPLVRLRTTAVAVNVDTGEEHSELYGEGLPYVPTRNGTSFEYSGSYVGMSRPVEPK